MLLKTYEKMTERGLEIKKKKKRQRSKMTLEDEDAEEND